MRSTWVAGSHSFERTIALAHWKNTFSTATTSTLRGALPCMVKLAHSAGSVEIVARPITRSVSLTPGNQEQQRDARVVDQVAQAVDAVVAAPVRDHQGLVVDARARSPWDRRAASSRARPGPLVASAKNGAASISSR